MNKQRVAVGFTFPECYTPSPSPKLGEVVAVGFTFPECYTLATFMS